MKTTELIICSVLFLIVAVMGFAASRWKSGETMNNLDEWGLGGRQFGSWITWFLIGGDLYTAYTFVAVPALLFGAGAMGFFAVPYATIAYPMVFLVLIRLWSVSHVNGFVTSADFVKARFGSRTMALLVAITGIVATMPYIALQLVGVQAVLTTMGVKGSLPLVIAFIVLALYTYNSGLRAPALIAFVKDILIYIVIIVAVIYIPSKLGGWDAIFGAAKEKYDAQGKPGVLLGGPQHLQYITLALGSALALMLYPHATTAILAARSRNTIKRNMAALPAYSLLLGLLTLLGYMAVASGIKPIGADPKLGKAGDVNTIVPQLFDLHFNDWFAGVAFAAIAIGALVPAAVMSIAASNTFTRNIYKEYFRPAADAKEETFVAKIISLVVKFGAVAFILLLDPTYAIDLQLVGGVIILTTLPAVGLGLLTNWFHRGGLIIGWVCASAVSLWMLWKIPGPPNPVTGAVAKKHFGGSGFPLAEFGFDTKATIWVGFVTVLVGIVVSIIATLILRAMKVAGGVDSTRKADYYYDGSEAGDETSVAAARHDQVMDTLTGKEGHVHDKP